jgi:hypothetical protein
LSSVFLLVPSLVLVRPLFDTRGADPVSWSWYVAVEAAVIAIAGLIVLIGLDWTRRQGLNAGEAVRLLFGATSPSSSWQSPALARLLRPTDDPEATAAPPAAR